MTSSLSWGPLLVAVLALGAFVVGALLVMRAVNRWSVSLRSQVVVVAMMVVAAAAMVSWVLGWLQVVDGRGLIAVSVVLCVTVPLALVVAIVSTTPLAADLRRLEKSIVSLATPDPVTLSLRRCDELALASAAVRGLRTDLDSAADARALALAAVTHDLRSPLTVLQVVAEGVVDGVVNSHVAAGIVEREVAVMAGLVDDLFLVSTAHVSKVHLERTAVDVVAVVAETVSSLQLVTTSMLQTVAVTAVVAEVDAVAVARMVTNMVTNAGRFAPTGSNITVHVDLVDAMVHIVVRDAGPGFPPEFVKDAFVAFSRPDASRDRRSGGAGLGLAVVAALATAHGGSVWVGPGPGGCVGVALPVSLVDG